jgi:hypothetical protein
LKNYDDGVCGPFVGPQEVHHLPTAKRA